MTDFTAESVVATMLAPCWGPQPTASALVIRVLDERAELVSINIDALETIEVLSNVLDALKTRLASAAQPSMMQ